MSLSVVLGKALGGKAGPGLQRGSPGIFYFLFVCPIRASECALSPSSVSDNNVTRVEVPGDGPQVLQGRGSVLQGVSDCGLWATNRFCLWTRPQSLWTWTLDGLRS